MPFFSKIYGSWNETQKEKYERILSLMKEHEIKFSGNVLDVGCGPFFFEKFLEEHGIATKNFTCVDIESQDSEKFTFMKANGSDLPFQKNHFDLLFCLDAIHLIKDSSEFKRVLKKGGYAIISSFFNHSDFDKVNSNLDKKLNGFKIISKTILKARENEIIVIIKRADPKCPMKYSR